MSTGGSLGTPSPWGAMIFRAPLAKTGNGPYPHRIMSPSNDASRPSILLVDDDAHLRYLFTIGLQKRGFNVITAGSAEDALHVAKSPAILLDMIVMDLVLPDSWGTEVAMELKEAQPAAEVVFISGYAKDDPILGSFASAAGVHFLPKPFTVNELSDLVHRVLDEAKSKNSAE